jgi:hypothetical protein
MGHGQQRCGDLPIHSTLRCETAPQGRVILGDAISKALSPQPHRGDLVLPPALVKPLRTRQTPERLMDRGLQSVAPGLRCVHALRRIPRSRAASAKPQ